MLERLLDVKHHRSVFYVSNVIFWVLGWGSLAVGIWLYTEKNSYAALAPHSYSAMSAAGLCICSGVMVLIISFIGCLGTWMRSRYLMISYFCFVCLLFFTGSITGAMGLFYKESVRHNVKFNLYATINRTHVVEHTLGPQQTIRLTWDQMQSQLQCCGVEGPHDWYFSPQWPKQKFVPDACCNPSFFLGDLHSRVGCGKNAANEPLFYKNGCFEPFTDWLLQHLYVIGIVALMFAFVEVFVLTTSMRLICHLYQQDKHRREDEPTLRYNRNGTTQEGECKLIPRIADEENILRDRE